MAAGPDPPQAGAGAVAVRAPVGRAAEPAPRPGVPAPRAVRPGGEECWRNRGFARPPHHRRQSAPRFRSV